MTESCPFCGEDIDREARFCASCGTALVARCPSCGSETRVGAQFCPSCGHRLDLAAPKREERKLVSVLFADLTGSTALGERLDPERLRVLLADYFRAMASVIDGCGGTVEKFIGDAVMAVFGIPTVHEDDAERALGAALDMQARLGELNAELAERHGVQLAVRIGVDTGEAIAGTGGDQLMVTGDVVNVAARLQQTARPGEILAGHRTYLATREAFEFEPREAKAVKGKAQPVPTWRVLSRAASALQRGVPGTSTRFVGRQRELSLLETLFQAALEDERPRLVTILGPAGIGKTRLTQEFVALAERTATPPGVYRGRCLPYGEGITYWPLREILWSAAGILLDDPGAVAAEKLGEFVYGVLGESAADASEAARVVHALATTAGVPLSDNPLDDMAPESIGEELGLAWPRLVTALASRRPTVVIVEDLHRGEPPLLDMIEHLVSRSSGQVLILATARPEFAELRPAWSTKPAISQIGLEPLSESHFSELLHELVPGVGAGLREKVHSTAEGNPFFAEQIVRYLLDEGILTRDDGQILEAQQDAPIAIPDTVRGLIAARVDALLPEEKSTLQDAAVVGKVFWATTLESMRPEGQIGPALRSLENKGLVGIRPTSSLPGQLELAFSHGLVRDVAYVSIPKARRAVAHAEVGRWVEELARDRRDEYIELIAYHYEAAARPEDSELAWPIDAARREEVRTRAVQALLDAGHAATTKFAIDQALGFGDRALALARTDADRLAALELKALAAHAIVRADEAWDYYLEALELAQRLGDTAAVGRLRAHATLLWARYRGAFTGTEWRSRAVEIVEDGLRDADENSVSFETGALLVGRAAFRIWELRPRDHGEAVRDAEKALEIGRAIGSTILLSYALDTLYALVQETGFCRSADIGERTLALAKVMEDRVEASEMTVSAAISFAEAGRFEEAVKVADEAMTLAVHLGPHRRLHVASAQTSAFLPAGLLDKLLQATGPAPELVAEEGMHTCFHGLIALAGQALAQFETNGPAAAGSVLAVFDATTAPNRSFAYGARVIEFLRPILGLEEARRRFDALERHRADTTIAKVYALRTGLQLAALAREWEEFERLAREARDLAHAACAPSLGWLADWGDSIKLAVEGRPSDAATTARRALEALASSGERYPAARLTVDLLPFLDDERRLQLAEPTARRLKAMRASTSAGEAREWASKS